MWGGDLYLQSLVVEFVKALSSNYYIDATCRLENLLTRSSAKAIYARSVCDTSMRVEL